MIRNLAAIIIRNIPPIIIGIAICIVVGVVLFIEFEMTPFAAALRGL